MALRVGTKYLVVDGKPSLIGKMVEVDPPGKGGCTIRVGDKAVRYKKDCLAATPSGDPILPSADIPTEVVTKVGGIVAKAERQIGRQRKSSVVTEEEDPRRNRFTARRPPVEEPVYRVGSWPMRLPPFTIDEVELVQQEDLPTFEESWYVNLPSPSGMLGVGLLWKSKADSIWRCTGGQGSTFNTKEQALQFLVNRRQPESRG
jgi:hypothetical protein